MTDIPGLRALLAAATPGPPWHVNDRGVGWSVHTCPSPDEVHQVRTTELLILARLERAEAALKLSQTALWKWMSGNAAYDESNAAINETAAILGQEP